MTISNNYVKHGYDVLYNDDFLKFKTYYENNIKETQLAFAEYNAALGRTMYESLSFYNYGLMDNIVYEKDGNKTATTAKKNLIEKLGDRIINLAKKAIEFIKNAIKKIKEFLFGVSKSEKDYEKLLKEHPELANEKIKLGAEAGALDLCDIKALSELEKEYDEIEKMSKRTNVDPKSLRGRWEKAKRKFFNEDGTLTKTSKVIAVATSGITLALLIKKFKSSCTEVNVKGIEQCQKLSEAQAEARDALRNANFEVNGVKFDDMTSVQQGYYIKQEMMGCRSKAIARAQSGLGKIAEIIRRHVGKFLDKNDTIKKANNSDLDLAIARKKEREEAEIKKSEEIGYNQAKGKNRADEEDKAVTKSAVESAVKKERDKYNEEKRRLNDKIRIEKSKNRHLRKELDGFRKK